MILPDCYANISELVLPSLRYRRGENWGSSRDFHCFQHILFKDYVLALLYQLIKKQNRNHQSLYPLSFPLLMLFFCPITSHFSTLPKHPQKHPQQRPSKREQPAGGKQQAPAPLYTGISSVSLP